MGDLVNKYYSYFFIGLLIAIVGLSFGAGYYEGKGSSGTAQNNSIVFSCPNTVLEKQTIASQVLGTTTSTSNIANTDTAQDKGVFVGSKNGTKYYTPGCPGTNRIKPENYIWFQSVEDATLQGYSKGSC